MLHPVIKFQRTSTIVACALAALRMPTRLWSGDLAPLGWRLSHLRLLRSCPSMSRSIFIHSGNLVFVVYFGNSVKQTHSRDILYIDFRQLREVPKHFSPDTLRYAVLEVSNVQTFLSSNAIKELNEACVGKSVYKILSQSTSIFQHQRAGFWCDHRPFVLCVQTSFFHHV